MPRFKITPEKEAYFLEHFKDTTNPELAKILGVTRSTICRWQRKHRLYKSKEHIHNMGVRAGKASVQATGGHFNICNTPEIVAKRSETYRKTLRAEKARYKWGLEQLTKIRLPREPRAKKDQRHNLQRRGYIVDEPNLIAYWTEGTDRSWKLEHRKPTCQFKCYYKFKPYGRLDKTSDGEGEP